MARTMLALALAGASLFATPALAQGEGGEPAGQRGREKRDRDQGNPEALKAKVVELLQALGAGQADKAKELLAALAPDEKVVEDILTPEGKKAIGEKLVAAAKEALAGEPKEVAERLKLDPTLSNVVVFSASTEDLMSMEAETDAAMHFAGGLKRASRWMKPRYRFYAVVLRKPEAEEGGNHVQLFVYSQERFVFLGKVWRLED